MSFVERGRCPICGEELGFSPELNRRLCVNPRCPIGRRYASAATCTCAQKVSVRGLHVKGCEAGLYAGGAKELGHDGDRPRRER